MNIRFAGEAVPFGAYVAINHLAFGHVSADGELLQGRPGTRFVRVPTWLLLLASPIVGAVYVVLFPLILAVAVATVLWHQLSTPCVRAWRRHAHLAHSRWAPTASFLSPVKDPRPIDEDQSLAELDALEAEVNARREIERRAGAHPKDPER